MKKQKINNEEMLITQGISFQIYHRHCYEKYTTVLRVTNIITIEVINFSRARGNENSAGIYLPQIYEKA